MIKNSKKQLKRQTPNSGREKNSEKTQKCTDISSVFKISLRNQICYGIAIYFITGGFWYFVQNSIILEKFRNKKKISAYITI